ncbi:MAG: hypothetical protein CR982_06470 [Candidatus Cloacimonadota bacterium]|nr:MAG: hypothetical protein CR982_06470 [Candidatus Cloacimonadota bacterium]PIE79933.1 MAG: hypothetical protein CSA15_02390 [Candidatus Delongbacteria bacterium]
MFKYIKLILFIVLGLFFASCEDRSSLTDPNPVNLGNADFSRFYTVGNSLTAGFQNRALYQSSQEFSLGNIIANQVGTSFEQPIISNPGFGGRLEIDGFDNNGNPIIVVNNEEGTPLNMSYGAPYNNLGVPGALLYDILNATNANDCASSVFNPANPTPNPFFDLVLRNSALNMGSQISQLKASNPSLVTLWAGNNDILGYYTHGGEVPFTPVATFAGLYNQLADSLAGTNADIFIGNIPDVFTIPFLTSYGPKIAENMRSSYNQGLIAGLFLANDPIPYSPDDLDSLKGMVTIGGKSLISFIGVPTGKPYLQADGSYNIPAGIDTTQVFGFHPANPFPDKFSISREEISNAEGIVDQYNSVIKDVCNSRGFSLVDINSFFDDVNEGGLVENGIKFTTDYISGNLFSFDGIHPTSQGYAVIANRFISAINNKLNSEIPLINVSTIPGSLPTTD